VSDVADPRPSSERDILEDLRTWVRSEVADDGQIIDLRRLPGHSGISYSFDIVRPGRPNQGVVMRVPPIGVRHQHNLDVVRLAPVLRLASQEAIPVPRVLWCGTDERWFGTPYLMVSREAGAPLPDVFDAASGPYPEADVVNNLFRQAIEGLANLHAVDAAPLAASGWARPQSVEEDILQWEPLLLKSEVESEIAATRELRELLLRRAPADDEITIVHGDFYSNNWLFDDGRLTALLDWENATLNRPMWDLGWIATIYDPRCWGPSRARTMDWHPHPHTIFEMYSAFRPNGLRQPEWYQALMCYRLASITPSKVRLHRSGRRVDPIWEVFAEAVPYQLDRAFELIASMP
jgi:aminoglycoside phosphotransferase (APT) family kinase protein